VSTDTRYTFGRTSDKTALITAHDGAVYPVAGVREKRQYDTLTDVLVMHLNDDGTPVVKGDGTPSIRLVPLRQIRATWAEGSEKLAQIAKGRAEMKQNREQREAERLAQFNAILPAMEAALIAADVRRAHLDLHRIKASGTVVLTLAEVAALLGITV
jgi:hypothetical protein